MREEGLSPARLSSTGRKVQSTGKENQMLVMTHVSFYKTTKGMKRGRGGDEGVLGPSCHRRPGASLRFE